MKDILNDHKVLMNGNDYIESETSETDETSETEEIIE